MDKNDELCEKVFYANALFVCLSPHCKIFIVMKCRNYFGTSTYLCGYLIFVKMGES